MRLTVDTFCDGRRNITLPGNVCIRAALKSPRVHIGCIDSHSILLAEPEHHRLTVPVAGFRIVKISDLRTDPADFPVGRYIRIIGKIAESVRRMQIQTLYFSFVRPAGSVRLCDVQESD